LTPATVDQKPKIESGIERWRIDTVKEEGKKEREEKRQSGLNLKCKYTQQITIGDRHPYF